jgi:hypothetical protein
MPRRRDRADGYDATPDFCNAVSLLAAIEGASGRAGHEEALPFLGMARAELVDFGERRPAQLVDIAVVDVPAGLRELDTRITTLLADTHALQLSLRLDAARNHVRRGIQAAS